MQASFNKLGEIIVAAIHESFERSEYNFSEWWKEDFATDYTFDSEDELKTLPKEDLENVKRDWANWILYDFTWPVLIKFGISDEEESNYYQIALIEVIYDITREEMLKKLDEVWK